jgi:hypothetical protein
MTSPSPADRIRRKLDRMQHDDAREIAQSTPDAIKKALRIRLNETTPGAAPEEIERRVTMALDKGAKPTTSAVAASPGIPRDVLAARRKERKGLVAKGRPQRRGG